MRPWDAARALVRGGRSGALATRMADGGAPYASLVTYAVDGRGQPVFLLSTLADHTRNLLAEGRACLLVEAASRKTNPQTGPRVSLQGTVRSTRDEALKARFLARHPGAALYAGFKDFGFFRLHVERAHYVGGFAKAHWYEAAKFLTPAKPAKTLEAAESGVLAHMNGDHAAAIDHYANALLGRKGQGWRMVGVDADGVDLVRSDRHARLNFPVPVDDVDSLRKTLVALARR